MWVAASCYAFAVLFGFASTHFTKSSLCKQGTLFTIILGFLFQTRGLYLRGLEISGCPLGNNLERVQFITWSLILTFLILRILWKLNLLGSLCSGMAAIFGIISLLNHDWDDAYWIDQNYTRLFSDPWIELHASIAIFQLWNFCSSSNCMCNVSHSKEKHSYRKKLDCGALSGHLFMTLIIQHSAFC